MPSFGQAGVPGFVLPVWNAPFAPRATPDAAVRRGVLAAGFTVETHGPGAVGRFIAAESARWGEIARATDVRLTD